MRRCLKTPSINFFIYIHNPTIFKNNLFQLNTPLGLLRGWKIFSVTVDDNMILNFIF